MGSTGFLPPFLPLLGETRGLGDRQGVGGGSECWAQGCLGGSPAGPAPGAHTPPRPTEGGLPTQRASSLWKSGLLAPPAGVLLHPPSPCPGSSEGRASEGPTCWGVSWQRPSLPPRPVQAEVATLASGTSRAQGTLDRAAHRLPARVLSSRPPTGGRGSGAPHSRRRPGRAGAGTPRRPPLTWASSPSTRSSAASMGLSALLLGPKD